MTFVDGPLVQELRHRYDGAHTQVLRLFKSSDLEVAQAIETRFALGVLALVRGRGVFGQLGDRSI